MIDTFLYASYLLILAVFVVTMIKITRVWSKFRYKKPAAKSQGGQLPTVSICMPARNEDHVMTDSLHAILKSDYPRFEVIVLDDDSVDNTSTLIKSFAHEGVRFVSGGELPSGWLGKNYALEELRTQASGEYLLFVDVDTRLSEQAVSNLVAYATAENATMVSVLPRRNDGLRASVVFSPLRYFWQIVFHKDKAPASASNLWMVRTDALAEYGGFDQIKTRIMPESHLASYFASHGKYRFLISSSELGVSYEKKWRSQLLTSVRLLYPSLGGSVVQAVMAMLVLVFLTLPVVSLVLSLVGVLATVHGVFSLGLLVSGIFVYGFYTKRIWRHGWFLATIVWPAITIQESVLIIVSVLQYKRHKVTWKGRPVQVEAQS